MPKKTLGNETHEAVENLDARDERLSHTETGDVDYTPQAPGTQEDGEENSHLRHTETDLTEFPENGSGLQEEPSTDTPFSHTDFESGDSELGLPGDRTYGLDVTTIDSNTGDTGIEFVSE
ncbi:MAG: hypothetical protein LBS19_02255, partial [Clostridiales bacterium]|nr:hypothetical protein [Clostridiales bacterium]